MIRTDLHDPLNEPSEWVEFETEEKAVAWVLSLPRISSGDGSACFEPPFHEDDTSAFEGVTIPWFDLQCDCARDMFGHREAPLSRYEIIVGHEDGGVVEAGDVMPTTGDLLADVPIK